MKPYSILRLFLRTGGGTNVENQSPLQKYIADAAYLHNMIPTWDRFQKKRLEGLAWCSLYRDILKQILSCFVHAPFLSKFGKIWKPL